MRESVSMKDSIMGIYVKQTTVHWTAVCFVFVIYDLENSLRFNLGIKMAKNTDRPKLNTMKANHKP